MVIPGQAQDLAQESQLLKPNMYFKCTLACTYIPVQYECMTVIKDEWEHWVVYNLAGTYDLGDDLSKGRDVYGLHHIS
jgi:hypothetical protein